MVPEVDSASNINEYQEYFLGVKAASRNFMSRLSLNLGTSNSWNPLGLSRPEIGFLYF